MKLKPNNSDIEKELPIEGGVLSVLKIPEREPVNLEFLAMRLYWRGWTVGQIAEEYGIPEATIYSWKKRKKWDDADEVIRLKNELYCQSLVLIAKGEKFNEHDMKIVDFHVRQLMQLSRIEKFKGEGGHNGHLNEKIANRNANPKKKPPRNFISNENREKLIAAIKSYYLEYQLEWVAAGVHKERFILKSRQIGATNTFALESLERGLETGYNQIFVSASRSQANNFRSYIAKFVYKHCGIELKGDPLILNIEHPDGILQPEYFFLGTNFRTAQGYTGDVYIDEVFWMYNFKLVYDVISGCASLNQYRVTSFSTPSTTAHEAYSVWCGESYNEGLAKDEQVTIDLQSDSIKSGFLGKDDIWRQKVTIDDAIAKGNTFINRDDIYRRKRNVFDNLYLCQPLDDSQSAFPISLTRPCGVDTWEKWKWWNYYAYSQKHLGKVWLGIDPSHSDNGDNTAFVVILPPNEKNNKFRVLEKFQYRGQAFEEMAAFCHELAKKYDIEDIAIDTTGIGEALYQLLFRDFRVKKVRFTPETKSALVYHAQHIFRKKRIEYDIGWTDLIGSMLAIYPDITKSGTKATYKARRTAQYGHGDLAWALLLALSLEPIDNEIIGTQKVIISEF